jgi:hypothetical protein
MLARLLVAGILVQASLAAQLTGLYTLHPLLPTGGTNFASFTDAVSALATQGVAGPVTIEIFDDAGPFGPGMIFYAPAPSPLSSNLALGDNQAVVVFQDWPGSSAQNPVVFRAASGEQPILDAMGSACVVYWNGADHTTIEGLELRGASHDAVSLYTASSQSAIGNSILRCRIHHCGRVGVLTYGNSGPVNDTIIAGNLFHDLMTSSTGGSFSGFIRDGYVAGRRDNNTRVVHNTFLCSTMAYATGWILGNYPSGATYTAYTQVVGNIFVKTAANGTIFNHQSVINTTACTAPVTLPALQEGNLYHDTSGGTFARLGTTSTSTVCPGQGFLTVVPSLAAWRSLTGRDLGSVQGDPRLSTLDMVPHRIAPTSPARDAAFPSSVAPLLDLDGDPRYAPLDIGADELPFGTGFAAGVGTGCAGISGAAARLLPVGVPAIGNLSFAVQVTGVGSGAAVYLYLAIGLEATPFPLGGGCSLYLDGPTLLAFFASGLNPIGPAFAGPTGIALFPLPVPARPSLSGQIVDLQAAATDPQNPAGFVVTNALDCILY